MGSVRLVESIRRNWCNSMWDGRAVNAIASQQTDNAKFIVNFLQNGGAFCGGRCERNPLHGQLKIRDVSGCQLYGLFEKISENLLFQTRWTCDLGSRSVL